MWRDLKNLLWLQGRLTVAMFRTRRASEQLHVAGVVLRIVGFLFAIPFFIAMGAGIAAISILLLSPQATYELLMLVNNGLFFVWLILPASYSSQIVERFEMSRLFAYPVRFRSIVVGSTLISLLTMTGGWSVLILSGEIVGLAWQQPLALPIILLGTLPTFAVLVLTGRIMEDLFDLVAGDRRLRTLVLTVMMLPFMLLGLGQSFFQGLIQNYDQIAFLKKLPIQDLLSQLAAAQNVSQFLEILSPSRVLVWLPAGWTTAGMASASAGAWGRSILFLAISLAAVGLLLWLHAGITRRLMQGAAVGLGAERVHSRESRFAGRLPGPPTFWALLRKDWTYLWRSPATRRMIFAGLMSILPAIFILWQPSIEDTDFHAIAPLAAGLFITVMLSMMINMNITSNYFGIIDREGFGALALSPIDRRQIIISANAIAFLVAMALYSLVLVLIGAFTHTWIVVPLGLCLGLCMQISGSPLYTLAAIIGPYRMQLQFTSGTRQRGNMWGMLAWLISGVPMALLLVMPYIFWKPALFVTIPVAILYSVVVYALTLKPLAMLLQRREHTILEAVTTET
ncbi:MAG: hypothetical protein JXR84_14140 [Anaerolineae bacterium]|nr:hypothetical protein [Anaerolineae bacterium]